MTSLLDIGPLTEEVPVGNHKITVYGVSPEGFFYLLEKFPALQGLLDNRAQQIDMEAVRAIAPASIAYAIAVATTSRAYMTQQQWLDVVEATANKAMNLSAHHQCLLFEAGLRLTFPEGIGPFIAKVASLASAINRVSGQMDPVTTSSKPSRSGFVTDSRGLRLGQAARPANSVH